MSNFVKPIVRIKCFSPLEKHHKKLKAWKWYVCEPFSGSVVKSGTIRGVKAEARAMAVKMAEGIRY